MMEGLNYDNSEEKRNIGEHAETIVWGSRHGNERDEYKDSCDDHEWMEERKIFKNTISVKYNISTSTLSTPLI